MFAVEGRGYVSDESLGSLFGAQFREIKKPRQIDNGAFFRGPEPILISDTLLTF